MFDSIIKNIYPVVFIFIEKFNNLKKTKYFNFLSKYLPIILGSLLCIFVFYTIKANYDKNISIDTFKNLILFLIISFIFSPIFIISSSLRFNNFKNFLNLESNYIDSLKSILIASSLDAFTPAKVNDFARATNEKNKKITFISIILERILDVFVLFLFSLGSINYLLPNLIYCIFTLLILLAVKKYVDRSKVKRILSLIICFFITLSHWLVGFIFYFTGCIFIGINNFQDIFLEQGNQIISLSRFSLMTLLSALPFSVGGFGIREASSIFIFPEVNSSLIVLSSLAYSIGVSGSITLIGIIYIYLRRKFPSLK